MERTNIRDLRVLYLGKHDEFRLNQSQRYLRKELKKLCHVDEYGIEWTHPTLPSMRKNFISDLVVIDKEFNPDVILIDSRKQMVWHNAPKITTPVAILMDDPHGARQRLDWINRDKIEMTLFKYIGGWEWWKERLHDTHKQRWLPHACHEDVFYERGLDRSYDFALTGRSHASTYPLRSAIYAWLGYGRTPKDVNKNYDVIWKPRHKRSWGWTEAKRKSTGIVLGDEYAEVLGSAKIYPTGSSVYKYAVTKCFEVMGTGTALAMNETSGDTQLGFQRDYNYIHIDQNTFKDKLNYYLENYGEAQKIASRAKELIERRHSTKVRAQELLKYFEELY